MRSHSAPAPAKPSSLAAMTLLTPSRILAAVLGSLVPLPAAEIVAEREGSVLRFSVEGRIVCDYQMEAGEVPQGVDPVFRHGAHLHPVYTPSGRIVTGNHPEDHRWHRGVWMAWTKTEFDGAEPDFWNMGKDAAKNAGQLSAEVRFVELAKAWSGEERAGFVSRHRFLDHSSGAERAVLDETWEVGVASGVYDGVAANLIDLVSIQTCASEHALRLPKFHYGGLGVRGNLAWNPVGAVTMLTSEGHDREAGDATTAYWVHLGGIVDGLPVGLAVLIHPANFRFPQPLRLNPKNPQLCVAPSQGGDWAIEPGTPLVSRYRLVAFDGEPDPDWLEERWQDYAESDVAPAGPALR
jgi:hypothetical protein